MDVTNDFKRSKDLNAKSDALVLGTITSNSTEVTVRAFDTATGIQYDFSTTSSGAGLVTINTTDWDWMDHQYQFQVFEGETRKPLYWNLGDPDEEISTPIVQVRFEFRKDTDGNYVRDTTQTVDLV